MGIYENFEQQLKIKKAEIIDTMNEIASKGINENVERLDIIIFLGDYEIVNVIMYSMNGKEEVFFQGRTFSGSVNLTGPIFLEKTEYLPTREEENKIKAQMMYCLEDIIQKYTNVIEKPIQLLFYKSPEAYNLNKKTWVPAVQCW